MLSQMGYKLGIADTILAILKDNYALCSSIDYSFIAHVVKLISKLGYKRKYLALLSVRIIARWGNLKILQVIVEAEGHPIPANQLTVIQLLFKKGDKCLLLLNKLPSLR